MDPLTLIYQSANLNNEGVTHLKAGRHEQSIASFKQALLMAKRITQLCRDGSKVATGSCEVPQQLQPLPLQSQLQQVHSDIAPMPASDSSKESSDADSKATMMCVDDDDTTSSSRLPFIYSKPMFITEIPYESIDSAIASLSFTTMFNLALAHHIRAVSCGGNARQQQRRFNAAKQLYEYTFQLQTQQQEANILLTTAILNNLAIVHKELGNTYEATQCERLLLSTTFMLVDMNVADIRDSVDGFLGNIMHMIVSEPVTALAA